MLFADRLEVWNPGELPAGLTPEKLRHPHASIPHNPLIAEPLFWVRYIEKLGTGTLDMIALCREAGLPEPEFRQDGGQWVVTLWRDWLSDAVVAQLGLSARQKTAVSLAKSSGRITNALYQQATGTGRTTAKRDLDVLVTKGVLLRYGRGRAAGYTLTKKRPLIGPNGPTTA